jgi:DNA repair protein RecN (Recombination protein N)
VLDAYGQCETYLNAYTEIWNARNALKQRLAEIVAATSLSPSAAGSRHYSVEEEIDRLQFIVDEITRAALTESDETDLIQQHAESANAEQILSLGTSITDTLTDGEQSVFDLLVSAQTRLTELAHILPEATEWKNDVQSTATQLQEIARAMNDRLSHIEAEPDRLQQLEDRMALVQRLKRKYGGSVSAILATCEKSQFRLHDLATRTEQIQELNQQIETATQQLIVKATQLTKVRTQAATKLAKAITVELRDLGFLKSGFSVGVSPIDCGPHGADEISFEFAPKRSRKYLG